MTTASYEASAAYPTIRGHDLRPLLAAWVGTLSPRRFLRARRWRAELAAMTDVELRDIGLTRGQIGAVAAGQYRG